MGFNIHWVDGPDDESETANGSEEVANLAALGDSSGAAVVDELPDNDEVGNASNGVPAPLLWRALSAKGSKETSENHDDIGEDGNQNAAAVHASEKTQVEEQKRSRQRPVHVTGPVDLAVQVMLGVWYVLVGVTDDHMVVANAGTAGHGEVRASGNDGDHGGDDVVQTLGLRTCKRCCLKR